jgi:hypothetical protein
MIHIIAASWSDDSGGAQSLLVVTRHAAQQDGDKRSD